MSVSACLTIHYSHRPRGYPCLARASWSACRVCSHAAVRGGFWFSDSASERTLVLRRDRGTIWALAALNPAGGGVAAAGPPPGGRRRGRGGGPPPVRCPTRARPPRLL